MPDTPFDIPTTAGHIAVPVELSHACVQITPKHDPLLAFEILVPKVWSYSRRFGPVAQLLFQPEGLGFFAETAELGAPIIAVTVTRSVFEIAIDAWAKASLAHEGWTLVKAEWMLGEHGPFFDLTAQRSVEGRQLIRRTSVRVDQGRILSVNCSCSRRHWDAVKVDFWIAHATFRLLQATDDPSVERWSRVATHDPGFETAYPASWSAEPAQPCSKHMSAVHIRLTDAKRATLLAYLFVQAERCDSTFPTTIELLHQANSTLEHAGVQLTSTPLPLSREDDVRAVAVQGWLGGFVAGAKLGRSEIQVRLGFVQRPKVALTFAMCTPTLEASPLVALRAQRTFEIVRSSLKLDPAASTHD